MLVAINFLKLHVLDNQGRGYSSRVIDTGNMFVFEQ